MDQECDLPLSPPGGPVPRRKTNSGNVIRSLSTAWLPALPIRAASIV